MNKLGWKAEGTTLTQDELDKYVKSMARPGTSKPVTAGKRNKKEKKIVTAGLCPCDKCSHMYSYECYKADCQCCSGFCT